MQFIRKILGLLILVFLSPLFFLVSVIIFVDDGFPILFKQKRVGLNSSYFTIYKFRTMRKKSPQIATHLMEKSDESYLTSSGQILRKLSLDELPQLLNIIFGEMAFIGPRPALFTQLNLIRERKVNGVDKILPGITGWAQINGRDELKSKEKVKYDIYYLKNKSLYLDLKIILLTIFKVSISQGINK